MKIPTWVYIVGIIMILFGGCGIIKEQQQIFLPDTLETQQKAINDFIAENEDAAAENEDSDTSSTTEQEKLEEAMKILTMDAFESMDKILQMSEFTKTWTVRFAIMGIIVSFLYLLGGVFLLIRKRFSIPLAYSVLILSMIFSLIRWAVLATDASSGLFNLALSFSNLSGIVFDFVLVIIIMASDKTYFREDAAQNSFKDLY